MLFTADTPVSGEDLDRTRGWEVKPWEVAYFLKVAKEYGWLDIGLSLIPEDSDNGTQPHYHPYSARERFNDQYYLICSGKVKVTLAKREDPNRFKRGHYPVMIWKRSRRPGEPRPKKVAPGETIEVRAGDRVCVRGPACHCEIVDKRGANYLIGFRNRNNLKR